MKFWLWSMILLLMLYFLLGIFEYVEVSNFWFGLGGFMAGSYLMYQSEKEGRDD